MVKPECCIDPDRFRTARQLARYSPAEAAAFLFVSVRTLQYWEKGQVRIPYSAFRLLRLRAGYDLIEPGWEGWCLHSGKLWPPAGNGFEPWELGDLALLCTMARHWREDYARRSQLVRDQVPASVHQLRTGTVLAFPQLRSVA